MENDYLNQHLLIFLRNWKKSVESDSPKLEYTRTGLCKNFFDYLVDIHPHNNNLRTFDFLSCVYFSGDSLPFNELGSYSDEVVYRKIHLNPKRVAWVNKTIIELENRYGI